MGTVSSKGPPGEGRSSRRSWRGGAGAAGAAEARPRRSASAPSWTAWGAGSAGGVRRWLAGVLLTACALALVGGFLYVVWRRPRATPLVCLHVTAYEAPLPPQAFAQEDVQRFTQLFHSSGWSDEPITTGQQQEIQPLNVSQGDEFLTALANRLQEVRPGGPNKDVILIYVSAQGVVDAEAKPCLLAAMPPSVEKGRDQVPTPGDILLPERMVRVAAILAEVKKAHPSAWKVVLLDSVRWDRNWRLGIAANQFADALPQVMEDLAASDKVVLINSCRPGEVSLADPAQGRTLFGEHVARGLWGEADTPPNGKIELTELARYLEQSVNATAQRRGRVQQPQLLWPGNQDQQGKPLDFVLALAQTSRCPPRASGEADRSRLANTAAKWNRLPNTGNRGVGISAALVVPLEKTRQELLRYEALLLAGKAYDEVTKTEPEIPASWSEEVHGSQPAVSLPLSLPASLDAAGIEQQQRSWAASFGPVPTDQEDPAGRLADHERLYGLWTALRDPNHPAPAAELFNRAKLAQLGALPIELRTWLRFSRGNSHLPQGIRDDAAAMTAFADCRELAERAAFASGDSRVYAWIEPAMKAADASRRKAEDLAFAGGDKAQVLALLAAATKGYQEAQARAALVREAFVLRDRALAELPYWLEWTSVGDRARVQLGRDLVGGVAALDGLLEGDVSAADASLQAAKDALAGTLASLDAAVDETTKRCLESSVHLGYLVELEQLLAGPLVDDADRSRLWGAYFDVLGQEKEDAGNAPSTSAAAPVAATRGAAAELMTLWLDNQRERPGFPALVESARAELTKDDKDFSSQGAELRTALKQSDRTIRGMTPWAALVAVRQLGTRHGAVLRGQCAGHDYLCWQARRFLEDFQANGDDFSGQGDGPTLAALAGVDRAGEPYFSLAATKLLDAADQLFPAQDPAKTRDLLVSRQRASHQLIQHVNQALRLASAEPVPTDRTTVTIPLRPADAAVQALPEGVASLHVPGADLSADESGLAVAVHAEQDTPGAEYLPLDIPGRWSQKTPPFVLPPQFTLSRRPDPWELSFYFRGHTGDMGYEFAPLKPGHVIASRRPGDTGRVTVASHRTKGTVVIVLDCSKSMQGELFRAANRAVQETIGELLRSEGIQISLIAFGHRRGIETHPTRKVAGKIALDWNDYFGPDDATVNLTNDFREVWSSSQSVRELEKIGNDGLKPMGATPLYDTLVYAAAAGFPAGAKARHMIILTDGRDAMPDTDENPDNDDASLGLRYDPAWDSLYNRTERRQARESAAAKALKDARLESLLLFDLTKTQQLKGVADALKAELVPIDSTEVLSRKILESIGIFDYRIAERGELRSEAKTAKTEEFTLPLSEYTLEPARIARAKVPFEIRGDELLSVRIDRGRDTPRIAFLDFDESVRSDLTPNVQLAQEEAARLEGNPLYPARYHASCAAERFVVGKKNRIFELTVRSVEEGRFTPRPREVWVEIVPARQSGGAPAGALTQYELYFFANPPVRAAASVPVLELDAPNWPAEANTALVSVWLRMTESTTGAKLTEDGGLVPASMARQLGIKIDSRIVPLPGGQGWAIRVSEQHTSAEPGQPKWCYVELERSRADTVTRRFYPANGLVEHDFAFRDLAPEALHRKAITVISQDDWKKSAAALAAPLVVAVPQQ